MEHKGALHGYSKINSERYGCSSARNKGESVCTNKKTIKRSVLEGKVLNALQSHLMRDDLVQVFCDEYARHMNALRAAQNAALASRQAEATKLTKERENIVQAIKDGVPASMIKDDLARVSARLDELSALTENAHDEPRPLIHPTMSRRYRSEIEALTKALSDGKAAEAREQVRGLIEKIVLSSKGGEDELSIDLYGDLAGILKIATEDKAMKDKGKIEKRLEAMAVNDNDNFEPSVQLVAGAGFEPATFGL